MNTMFDVDLEGCEYVARCFAYPSMTWGEGTPTAAMAGLAALVYEVYDDMLAGGEPTTNEMTIAYFEAKAFLESIGMNVSGERIAPEDAVDHVLDNNT